MPQLSKGQFEGPWTPTTGSAVSSLGHSTSDNDLSTCQHSVVAEAGSGVLSFTRHDPSALVFAPSGQMPRALLPAGLGIARAPTLGHSVHELVVADEKVKATTGEDTSRVWFLAGAGVYRLEIDRVSAFTAHCSGTVSVIRQDNGEVIWGLSSWRSDKSGVDTSFSIPIEESCIICLTMKARHFSSRFIRAGRSVAQVRITQTASMIKSRFPLRTGNLDCRSSLLSGATPTHPTIAFSDRQSFWSIQSSDQVNSPMENGRHCSTAPKPWWDDTYFDATPMERLVRCISRKFCKRFS